MAGGPSLVIARDGCVTVPDDQFDGAVPTKEAACLAAGKRLPSPRNARMVGATVGPTPGTDSNNSSSLACHQRVACAPAPATRASSSANSSSRSVTSQASASKSR